MLCPGQISMSHKNMISLQSSGCLFPMNFIKTVLPLTPVDNFHFEEHENPLRCTPNLHKVLIGWQTHTNTWGLWWWTKEKQWANHNILMIKRYLMVEFWFATNACMNTMYHFMEAASNDKCVIGHFESIKVYKIEDQWCFCLLHSWNYQCSQ